MKLGFVSRLGEFPQSEWEEEFQELGEKGASHLELEVTYPYFGPSTVTPQDLKKVRALAEDNNLELTLHLMTFPGQYVELGQQGLELDIASFDMNVRRFSLDEIKRTLQMAQKLGAGLVVIHGGKFPTNEEYDDYLERSRRSLDRLNREIDMNYRGIRLCIENLPIFGRKAQLNYELPKSPEDILYLVKDLANIGICYDIGHGRTFGDPINFYNAIKQSGKVWDMHLHDNTGHDSHLGIGSGIIDFNEFFRQLRSDGYDGLLSIELDTWTPNDKPMKREERKAAFDYLSSL